ncbi:hypothetical protein CK203_018963 [Vitis vinifera]|uniref:Uncharacterized protein n=1 Tax=Vitis vinifera TaxID=29760 RepID=A0A438IR01_VITVI|nr:hypothetical protein CK203_018963 [Vitis vinifera]
MKGKWIFLQQIWGFFEARIWEKKGIESKLPDILASHRDVDACKSGTPFLPHNPKISMNRLSLSVERWESLYIKKPPGNVRKCMCGGDDHLAWKHPVSLRRAEGCVPPVSLDPIKIFTPTRWCICGPSELPWSQLDSVIPSLVSFWCNQMRFAVAMASIQEAIASLGQMIDGQQAQQVPVQEDIQFDTTAPPPPPHMPTPISEDPHARMDKLKQKLRQMRTSEGAITWEDFDGAHGQSTGQVQDA